MIFIDELMITNFMHMDGLQKARDCLLKNLHLRRKGSVLLRHESGKDCSANDI
ncbi:hypothetical protein [Candidatus Mesenet endosymbiont of Phosphuga atrata]|uniref:hypothetical protein n=1 Tax=Candidatus Mesenet endosymbiont of Phosphuga atrata TaxID=3066221 RepID=UPI0030D0226C